MDRKSLSIRLLIKNYLINENETFESFFYFDSLKIE